MFSFLNQCNDKKGKFLCFIFFLLCCVGWVFPFSIFYVIKKNVNLWFTPTHTSHSHHLIRLWNFLFKKRRIQFSMNFYYVCYFLFMLFICGQLNLIKERECELLNSWIHDLNTFEFMISSHKKQHKKHKNFL